MNYAAVVLLATVALCVAAYKLAARSDVWAVGLSALLLPFAWFVLAILDTPPGEGAAAGVAVLIVGAWYVGGACVLLAAVLLGTSFWFRRSAIVGAIILLSFFPFLVTLGNRLTKAGSQAQRDPPQARVEPRADYTEGYAWALDNGIRSDAECTNGTPRFVEGCKNAVLRAAGR